ncbi:response regulator transcription factor [Alicyclobacillus tolerans]|uniref:response regulator transcription factor n=1 Tax=Alicyclobacillus tolerans TaxID=90970 RepID=UPI001F26E69C|nr:response regulator transcription factor [Alicyclobacillus tolerans]MCF8568547.1 response regulator transcription factor [Alicyclobacillus tolerans]
MSQDRILVIEDQKDIAEFIRLELEYEGYTVSTVTNGIDGLELSLNVSWSLILLDIMLPGLNGMEVCRRVRSMSNTPIIMLTARHSVPDRVAGLDCGANDYIAKPFAIEELLARIRACIRRNQVEYVNEVFTARDIVLNEGTHEVVRNSQQIFLTKREFSLLAAFMKNQNHVMTREQLLHEVWGYDFAGDTSIVDVYVKYLRRKLNIDGASPVIETIRGFGYILRT